MLRRLECALTESEADVEAEAEAAVDFDLTDCLEAQVQAAESTVNEQQQAQYTCSSVSEAHCPFEQKSCTEGNQTLIRIRLSGELQFAL